MATLSLPGEDEWHTKTKAKKEEEALSVELLELLVSVYFCM